MTIQNVSRTILRRRAGHTLLSAALLGTMLAVAVQPAHAQTAAPPVVSGTVEVSTASQLEYIDQNQTAPISSGSATTYLTAHIELTNNIDVTGYTWVPWGDRSAPFVGTFNGENFTLTGISLSCPPTPHYYCGMFGVINGGTVENLNQDTSGTPAANLAAVGGIAGELEGSGVIQHVTVSGSFGNTLGGFSIGGIVGNLTGTGTIRDATNAAAVTGGGGSDAGGLVGYMDGSSILADSANVASVSGTYTGGVVGGIGTYSYASATVSNVYNTGSVSGQYAGGLFTTVYGTNTSVSDAYTDGLVTGSLQAGGIATGSSATLSNVYYSPSLTGQVDGIYGQSTTRGITPVSTPTQSMFPGLNFTSVWGLSASVNQGWPYLLGVGPNPPVWTPPVLTPETVTVGTTTAQVVGNFGYNPEIAVQSGGFVGYVEERAAIEAGASFTGQGTNSSYLSAILDGSGVGLQQQVTAVQQGQFTALYQKLGIIPTWVGNAVAVSGGVKQLLAAGASTLAVENYLVQLDGFSWPAAISEAARAFPIQSGT